MASCSLQVILMNISRKKGLQGLLGDMGKAVAELALASHGSAGRLVSGDVGISKGAPVDLAVRKEVCDVGLAGGAWLHDLALPHGPPRSYRPLRPGRLDLHRASTISLGCLKLSSARSLCGRVNLSDLDSIV